MTSDRTAELQEAKDIDAIRAHTSGLMSALRESGLLQEAVFAAPACSHRNTIPVALVLTGEVVARLCPDCDQQLSTDCSR